MACLARTCVHADDTLARACAPTGCRAAALAFWFPGGERLYVARWLHRRCAAIAHRTPPLLSCVRCWALRRLVLFGFLAHEALRKRSASGSAGNVGIQVRRSGLAGLAALVGGYSRRTHRVLTACSRRSKWSLKKGVLVAGYSTQRHSRRGGAWQDQRLALQWVQENIRAFGGASRPEYSRRP